MKRFLTFLVGLAASFFASATHAEPPYRPARIMPVYAPENLTPAERAQFARWGLAPEAVNDFKDQAYLRSRVRSEWNEAIKQGRYYGDTVAYVLVAAELNRRCLNGGKPKRSACEEWVEWDALRSGYRPKDDLNKELLSNTITLYDIINVDKAGDLFYLGKDGYIDYEKSKQLYQLVVDYYLKHKNVYLNKNMSETTSTAYLRLGTIYQYNLTGQRNIGKASQYYIYSPGLGQYLAAQIYYSQGNKEQAAYAFDGASEHGIIDAKYRLAQMIEYAETPPGLRSSSLMYELYAQAARAGHVEAMKSMARGYQNGWHASADPVAAREWWIRAANAGDGESAFRVASAVRQSGGNNDEVYVWLKKSADTGYPRAVQTVQQWKAQGYEEKSFGRGLKSVLQFATEVGNTYVAQQQQAEAAARAQDAITFNAVAALHAQSLASGTTATGGTGAWQDAGGHTSSDSGTDSGAGLTLDDDPGQRRARFESEADAYQKQLAEEAARRQAFDARNAAYQDDWKAKYQAWRDKMDIACHGSVEAARRATVSCQ
ncbi:MAG: hypothetical protein QM667_13010 [Asticcacaulis sp.]